MGVFERGLGPVTARKLRAAGVKMKVENSVNINLPTLLVQCARGMGHTPLASLNRSLILRQFGCDLQLIIRNRRHFASP